MLAGPILALGFIAAAAAAAGDDAANQNAALPVVVLIGDSIRLGYAPIVAEQLAGKATVLSVSANGGDTERVLKNLEAWAISTRPAVVHFNAGLHDLRFNPETKTHQVALDDYESNLRSIVKRLETETNATLIFATTTPVIGERHNVNRPTHRHEDDVKKFNRAALGVMAESPVVRIDDLHALITNGGPDTLLGGDGVHFTKAGYARLGAAVAGAIEQALSPVPATDAAVCRWVDTPPKLDGKLDDPAWKNAMVIDRFPAFWAGKPATVATQARLVWSADALYFSAVMSDSHLRSFGTKRNDRLWEGDVFELFFKPDEAKPRYYEFQVNPIGVILELAFPERGFDFETLAKADPLGFEAVVATEGKPDDPSDTDRSWTVEGKIPWSVFEPSGGKPAPGAVWRFALCRYDYGPSGSKPQLMSSAPLRRMSFHRYEDYGRLTFEK